jgi:replicative DNA helicase
VINTNWIESFIEAAEPNLENILLCKILVSKKLPPDIIPEYFTGNREKFYRAIENQWIKNKVIDPVLLKVDFWENMEAAIKERGSSSDALLDRLHALWQKREIGKMVVMAGEIDNPAGILENFQSKAGKIALKKSGAEYNHQESMMRLLEILERAQKNKTELAGYSTGLSEIDRFTSGIEKGKTYFVGALKKSGKSRFAVHLAIKMREQGAGVLFNSLEMNEVQLNTCALAYYSGLDSNIFGRAMPMAKYQEMQTGFSSLSELNWSICRERTVKNLRARALQIRNEKNIEVLIVDFLQRMKHDGAESRTREVEAISMDLADLSRELDIAVIGLTQLTGAAEHLGDDEMPNMSHMKESQGIAENGDCLITLHNFDRRKNPFSEDGSYKLQEIYCLIEQRYDVSGVCFKILGDLRNCQFKNHNEPYEPRGTQCPKPSKKENYSQRF